jgi:hypothetical protein
MCQPVMLPLLVLLRLPTQQVVRNARRVPAGAATNVADAAEAAHANWRCEIRAMWRQELLSMPLLLPLPKPHGDATPAFLVPAVGRGGRRLPRRAMPIGNEASQSTCSC